MHANEVCSNETTVHKALNKSSLHITVSIFASYCKIILLLSLVCFLTGNLDWVGKEFTYNAGAGLVISHPANVTERNSTVVEQLQAVFKRDWFSRYANTIQTNKIPVCSKQQINKSVLFKPSHRNYEPLPGQHDARPAPLRNHPKADRPTPDKIAHREDGLKKISSQSLANEQGPVMNNHQERAGIKIKMSDLDDERAQVKEWKFNISEDPPSRWAESSGFREISNGSL